MLTVLHTITPAQLGLQAYKVVLVPLAHRETLGQLDRLVQSVLQAQLDHKVILVPQAHRV